MRLPGNARNDETVEEVDGKKPGDCARINTRRTLKNENRAEKAKYRTRSTYGNRIHRGSINERPSEDTD